MENVKAKAKEISTEREYLRKSQNTFLIHQKELENEVLELIDEVVSSSNIYSECPKKHVSFLYPNLDLSQMDLLKVVCGGQLVDEEVFASWYPKSISRIEDTQGGVMEGSESGVP